MAMNEWSTGQKVGCGCLVVALLLAGACATLVFGVFSLVKSSSPYTDSLEIVKASPEVQAAIGEPIEAQFWASGSVNVEMTSGRADLIYGVQGPDGSGNVTVFATKSDGEWTYSTILFEDDDSPLKIELAPGVELPVEPPEAVEPAEPEPESEVETVEASAAADAP